MPGQGRSRGREIGFGVISFAAATPPGGGFNCKHRRKKWKIAMFKLMATTSATG